MHVRKARCATLAAGATGPSTALPACPGAQRRSLRGLAKHAIDRATCARVNRPAHLHVRHGEETLLGGPPASRRARTCFGWSRVQAKSSRARRALYHAELEPHSSGAGGRPRAAQAVHHAEPEPSSGGAGCRSGAEKPRTLDLHHAKLEPRPNRARCRRAEPSAEPTVPVTATFFRSRDGRQSPEQRPPDGEETIESERRGIS